MVRVGWYWLSAPVICSGLGGRALGKTRSAESSAPAGTAGQMTGAAGIAAPTLNGVNGEAAGWISRVTLGASGWPVAALAGCAAAWQRPALPLLRLDRFTSGGFTAAGLAPAAAPGAGGRWPAATCRPAGGGAVEGDRLAREPYCLRLIVRPRQLHSR